MKLLFLTNSCNLFGMEVETVQEMKEKVERYMGVPISKQTLEFNGNTLRHELDLHSAGLKRGSIIHLQIAADYDRPWPQRILLRMPPPWASFNLEFRVSRTVERLKRKIQELAAGTDQLWGQVVVIKNRSGIELPDQATLIECQILLFPEVTVEFRQKMVLKVRSPELGKVIIMELSLNLAIEYVRERIQLEFQRQITSPHYPSILLRDERGMELHDGRTLLQCQICDNSTLTVEFRQEINLVVKSPGTGINPVLLRNLRLTDTIEKVKEHLEIARGLSKGRMVVRQQIHGDELSNEKRLFHCDDSFSLIVEIRPRIPAAAAGDLY